MIYIYKQFSHIYSIKKDIFLDCLKIKHMQRIAKQKNLKINIPIINTYTRWSRILPIMSRLCLFLINGQKKSSFFLPLQDKHITFRLGEFLPTRKINVKHKGNKKKIKIKPKEIILRRKKNNLNVEEKYTTKKKLKKRF